MSDHAEIVRNYPDALLLAIITQEGKRNLRNYQDHQTRWMAQRLSAVRAERRRRKEAAK